MICAYVHLYIRVSDFSSTCGASQKKTWLSFLAYVIYMWLIDISSYFFWQLKGNNTQWPNFVLHTKQIFLQLLLTFVFLDISFCFGLCNPQVKQILSQRAYALSGQDETSLVTFPRWTETEMKLRVFYSWPPSLFSESHISWNCYLGSVFFCYKWKCDLLCYYFVLFVQVNQGATLSSWSSCLFLRSPPHQTQNLILAMLLNLQFSCIFSHFHHFHAESLAGFLCRLLRSIIPHSPVVCGFYCPAEVCYVRTSENCP